MASVTVQYAKTNNRVSDVYSHALSVRVLNAMDMPKDIFVVYRSMPSPTDEQLTGDFLDEFNHVATPEDLYTLPVKAPNFEKTGAAYRTDQWDFSFRTPADLEDSLQLLRGDIRKLVESLNAELETEPFLVETYPDVVLVPTVEYEGVKYTMADAGLEMPTHKWLRYSNSSGMSPRPASVKFPDGRIFDLVIDFKENSSIISFTWKLSTAAVAYPPTIKHDGNVYEMAGVYFNSDLTKPTYEWRLKA